MATHSSILAWGIPWTDVVEETCLPTMGVPTGWTGEELAAGKPVVSSAVHSFPTRRSSDLLGSIPGSVRFPGEGNGNPLQYSGLENSMDRGAWEATVQGIKKCWRDWGQEEKGTTEDEMAGPGHRGHIPATLEISSGTRGHIDRLISAPRRGSAEPRPRGCSGLG